MPLHPWQFHHLALGNRKGRGERISSLQRAVRDIMGEDWNVRMQSGEGDSLRGPKCFGTTTWTGGCMPGGSTSGNLLGPAKRHMGMPSSIGKG